MGKTKHPLLGHSILAKKDTWLTRHPVDSVSLQSDEKLFVPKGSAWEWLKIIVTAGDLYREVRLKAKPDTSWYFYEPDWKIINDVDETIEYKPNHHIQLNTPYFRHNSGFDGADCTCFSSSCAMLLKTLRERCFEDYEEYLESVSELGDGAEAWVQIKALGQFGLDAEFRQDGDWLAVEELIQEGIPVPLGILHFGPVENPSGSGHWVTAVGVTKDQESLIVHDPYGDLDLHSGVYTSDCGSFRKYSKKQLSDRWMVEKGYSSGWYIKAHK